MYVTNKPATAIIIALAAFLIATLALACSSATPRAGDVNTDRAALATLYNATNGSSWQNDTNWLSNRPLGEWYGVSTDADGRVTGLSLGDNQLSGPIPAELGNLANLQFLGLGGNQLSGSIPSELGNLANLDTLSLYGNQLSGSIPSELGNLDNLERLSLRNNHLSGSIPSELGNLANLDTLSLYGNELSGSIPAELGNLANLEHLLLGGNQLSGSIPPELGNLANLEFLWLRGNQLSGSIPPELGNLASLQELYLGSNQLSGSIPAELGNLANLQFLWLLGNQLSGSIPFDASHGGQFLHRRLQLRLLRLAKGGGNPQTARKSRRQARPRQRRRPIVRWCADLVPGPALYPKPSILGPAARWRAIVPAPGVSALE